MSLRLNGRRGFEKDYVNPITQETPHGQVFAWYSGTVDLALDRVKVEGIIPSDGSVTVRPSGTYGIYDQLGDKDLSDEELKESSTQWYSSEGIGEGWFYSVLGGGKSKRLKSVIDRVPLSFDNTLESRMRGDYAVPTLF
ncbi:MAG: hypothetical protein HC820_00335 [Hydrococcus sp. RM1_1_31]|nr:hypothetical protein [Hydrococcus sp. RM1_1_31]